MATPCISIIADYSLDKCNVVTPGFRSMKVTEAGWIDAFPAVDTTDTNTDGMPDDPETITGDITLDTVTYADASWALIQLTKDLNAMVTEQTFEGGIKSYTTTITGAIGGNDPKALHTLHQLSKGELVIQLTDASGQNMIVGSPLNPAELVFTNREIGAAQGDNVQMGFTITWSSHTAPVPFYSGTAL